MDKTQHNYYLIRFTNNEEKFIQTDLFDKTENLIGNLEEKLLGSDFFKLKQINTERERNPVYHSKSTIYTIEKVNSGIIGYNNKLWEIL